MNFYREKIPRQSRGLQVVLVTAFFLTVFFLNTGPAILNAEPLLLVRQATVEATFLSATTEGDLQFEVDGQTRRIHCQNLIRWSTQPSKLKRSELLLTDGSCLVLADAWTGQPIWQMTEGSISAATKLFGTIIVPRNEVRAILLHAPKGLKQRRQFLDQLLQLKGGDEKAGNIIRLTNGDQWQGQVVRLANNPKGPRLIHLLQDTSSEPLLLPENRVAAIRFGHPATRLGQTKKLVVGLREGSLLMAESIVTDDEQLRLQLANGVELTGSDRRDVVHLRSLTSDCVYLSDLVATDYRHLSYLDIPWPYHRDRNVLGGPLQVAGRSYAKGLGMLTAARLTYRLDTKDLVDRVRRLVATVAVDDAAARRGSVIFRVYLQNNGDWQQAFASPVVRGGDPPVSVSVELGDAQKLALVTDYADRGDECDYANWLDARLE
ncbi:MAG: hypothetical protein GXP24_14505 [Planctomycetes bacterium]|nr:hypothetical protein [Planctomycetota bacterium]